MEYKIVVMETYVELESFVNNYIRKGWTPIGGIGIRYNPTTNDTLYFQAMMKNKKKQFF